MNPKYPTQGPTGASASNSAEINLVVARYKNGEVVKGYTRDFFPDRPLFHVLAIGSTEATPVKISELKGVFFVRDLVGNKVHTKNRKFPVQDSGPNQGRRIAVQFEDGELLVGYAQTYSKERPGFFVFPHDPQGNTTRVYVLRDATRQVKLGPMADELARNAQPVRKKPPAAA